MIDPNRYFITSDTKLAAALVANGAASYLHIDESSSSKDRVYLVLTNPNESEIFSSKFTIALNKIAREIDTYRFGGNK